MGMFEFNDVGIDLGPSSVLVYVKNKGIVLREPSVVAVEKITGKIYAVGEEARRMLGRTPGNIVAIRPLRDGVISNFDITERLLRHFLKKVVGTRIFFKPRVVVCVPSGVTEVEKRSVIEATEEAGFQAAHAIINGEYDDAIGGGICQVATTVFNAVYEAGYPVTERRNHSLYISSYPTGRDAAIAYPDLDLTWVNDGTSDVLMRSRYTDSSLTVTLYGIDPGYVVSTQTGDWETGEPFKKRTKVDESEPEGTRYVKTAGADGRSVTVHRTVRDRAGNVLHEEDFTSNYAPIDEVTVVGPNTPTREREDADKEATDKEEASVLSTGD